LDLILKRFEEEPYAKSLGIRLVELEYGRALVSMTVPEGMENLFGVAHGGAVFSLIDGAFEAAANSHGTIAVALNVSVTYLRPASVGESLHAEAREISRSARISSYEIRVVNEEKELIATCQALAYRKKERLPFL
jgi:acyl-CoA thioesterase